MALRSARGSKDSPLSAREEDRSTDDMSTGLYLQQFMDEWYYRCIHSGLANEWDREKCAVAALDLFELQGVQIRPDEKPALAMRDDDSFIEAVVKRMPGDVRKTFEHFALQLQLVMSAASRVRCALEEGPPEEVARIMMEGDQGVNSQILKQTIVEATLEVDEIRQIHESWLDSMTKRVGRLGQCQLAAEQGKIELRKLNIKLDTLNTEKDEKKNAVINRMASKDDKAMKSTVFRSWWTFKVKNEHEMNIRRKFQKQIDDAKATLLQYKQAQIKNITGVLARNSHGNGRALLLECFRLWAKDSQDEKEEKELAGTMEASRAKMGKLKAAQKDNAQKSMMRIVAGNEESLRNIAWQSWVSVHEELKKNQDFEKLVKAQEEKMQEFMKRKTEEAKGVLSKISSSSETGLVHAAFNAWLDDYKSIKKGQELEDQLNNHNARLKSLNGRVKAGANSVARRSSELEKENTIMQVFMKWHTEAKLGRLILHYSGKMDKSKKQIKEVERLFKDIDEKINKGITVSPRSTKPTNKTSSRTDKSDHQTRPPQMPSNQVAAI
mmetsp:Transcript_18042/g.54365  ORF Transcript_18042/g.54365 Transcript_18042/m.54365 type:complete len:552 (-) Transcript_18042:100-1755(-)|eukprot:CAMPEP_0175247980 /NCGR_PEP_ID=MMETSP0093-20121207/33904_1 /TAXON_ID=311494 /ORGANISM="Alexandrium monilatum, Strain CCMP3105" /LENGTH=551 /DNA_ID=CAMNT_0016542185 /DNA_START=86 /DNA_END=1741 /DNA_ORIENTATION=+